MSPDLSGRCSGTFPKLKSRLPCPTEISWETIYSLAVAIKKRLKSKIKRVCLRYNLFILHCNKNYGILQGVACCLRKARAFRRTLQFITKFSLPRRQIYLKTELRRPGQIDVHPF